MANNLVNINRKDFSAYVSENPYNINTLGALTITYNVNGSSGLFPSEYGLYVDDTFIASGVGFKDKLEYISYMNDINTLKTNVEHLNELLNEENDDTQRDIEIIYDKNEYNVFGNDYNKYGTLTSYNYIDLNNNSPYSYLFTPKHKQLTNYITDIKLSNLSEDVEYNNNFTGKILITLNSGNQLPDDINVYYKYFDENNEREVQISNTTNNFSISNNEVESKDLYIVIKRNDNVIYEEKFENVLKWVDKLYISSSINNNLRTLNNYDFYYDYDSNKTNIDNALRNLINDNIFTKSFLLNEDIELNFDNSDLYYDYVILKNEYNIDFYYNGIKTNSWDKISFMPNSNQPNVKYFIYQSPQKYLGKHTWIINIKKAI